MSGTIRANGDNSRTAVRKAQVTIARRRRAQDRAVERYYDERAIALRTAQNGA
jgi:hypothetical protein